MKLNSEITFNPITPLYMDKNVRNVFSCILTQRFNTSILSGYFKLGDECSSFDLPGIGGVSTKKLVNGLLDFLVKRNKNNPDPVDIAKEFWDRFSFRGNESPLVAVPIELNKIFANYSKKIEKVTDLLLIKDLLKPEFLPNGTIVDFGSGRNKLGKAIIDFADLNNVNIKNVIGTDINDFGSTIKDKRHTFVQQIDTTIPIENNTIDLVIIKWAFHHMNNEMLKNQIGEIARILSDNGRIVVIEALMGIKSELYDGFKNEKENEETWPKNGKWFKERDELTKNYLKLNLVQQKSVLAMEDYYGNWLEQRFIWMPLPFNYMSPKEISKQFSLKGFQEEYNHRWVFGMAPIIHWGPPTVRLVYRNQQF